MLQQTTVATVIPRFVRFMSAFPTVAALASAKEQEVLRLWEGLGYYNRARNLLRAAHVLVQAHKAGFPDDPAVWAELPGVGPYIANAVLSQAFDRRLPIVEANTTRLYCRLFGQSADVKSTAVRRWLWDVASAILPHQRSGDFNQALMELGSQVCTSKAPACGKCPLRGICVARHTGTQDRIPRRTAPAPATTVREVCLVPRRGRRVLLMRRPSTGRWANMWEFPRTELSDAETVDAGGRRLLLALGLRADWGRELQTVRHVVTRFRIVMACREAVVRAGRARTGYYVEGRWLNTDQLPKYPVSSPQRELANELQRQDGAT